MTRNAPSEDRVAFWCSRDDRVRVGFEGRARSLLAAMHACEAHHGGPLVWGEVESIHYSARAGVMVYSVRVEA